MRQAITEERVLLDGHTLTLTFRSGGLFFACDLRALDGGTVRTAPLLALGAAHSGSLSLAGLAAGIYGLVVRSSIGGEPFGRQIAVERANLAEALRGSGVAATPSKVATAAFAAAEGEHHVGIYADLPTRELRVRISADDDIDAFLAPWSTEAPALAPIRFSLVAPVHNVEKYLNEFIASFTSQTLDFHAHAELILVDDGSTDGSARIIKSWQRRYPDNIRYLYQENAGVAAARNLGLSVARHEWVSFPDPDDFVDRDYFAEVAEAIDRHREDNIALIACYMLRYLEASSQLSDTMPLRFRFADGEKVLPANNLGRYIQGYCNGAFFRRALVEAADLTFDPRVRPTFEDGHFVGKFILSAADANVLFLPQAKYYYRKRSDRSSIMDSARQKIDWYSDALRHGHLDLLKFDYETRGAVSPQIQNSVLHALSFRLQEMADKPGEGAFLTAEQRQRYREILTEIFAFIDAETIMDYDIADMPYWHRIGMLNLFKGMDAPEPSVEIKALDAGTSVAEVIHWSRHATPTARYTVDGVPLVASDVRSHKRLFADALFVWEHTERVRLPANGTLAIAVGDAAARIVLPDEIVDGGVSLAHLRRAFVGIVAGGDIAARIDTALWRGFSQSGLRDLGRLHDDAAAFLGDRLAAAFGIARWHAAAKRYDDALDWLTRMHGLTGGRVTSIQSVLLEAECLINLGQAGEARLLLEREIVGQPELDPDLCLAYQSCFAGDPGADELRLDWINRVFEAGGLHPITRRDRKKPLGFDNIWAPSAPKFMAAKAPKVSLIMPVHNAEDTIAVALDSVLAQTWQNLEVIVVDDHSTDATWDIVRAAAERAPIVALRQDRNGGAYLARNRGLEVATGDLITTHDADDWSHPQQVEMHARHMMERPGLQGTRSSWARVAPNLNAMVVDRPGDRPICFNHSSFTFTRRIRDQLGGWDAVRVSADQELIARAGTVVDYLAFAKVANNVPLAFGLRRAASLTGTGATHVFTLHHGARRDYAEAAERWHQRLRTVGGARIAPGQRRTFPAPHRMLPNAPPRAPYDLVFVFDFADPEPGTAFAAVHSMIAAALRLRKRVGVFLWRDYEIAEARPDARIAALIDEWKVDLISAGDAIEARTVIIGQPGLLKHRIDNPPVIHAGHVAILAGQPAFQFTGFRGPLYDPKDVAALAAATFGRAPAWLPMSASMRRLMLEDPRYPAPHPDLWLPLLDATPFTDAPVHWRGGETARPVVARISRDGAARWPSSADALLAAYCADQPCDVRILGGARTAIEVAGRLPQNWTVFEAGAAEAAAFLKPADFLVHYAHEDLAEVFCLASAQAMAAGKPVIAPPAFAEIFGPAAVYAEPHEVWPAIRRLWSDEAAYVAQAQAGRDFAVRHLGLERFAEQLAGLEEPGGIAEVTRAAG